MEETESFRAMIFGVTINSEAQINDLKSISYWS